MNDVDALIRDVLAKIDDNPTADDGILGTLDYGVDANGVGHVDVRTLDGDVITVVVMVLHPTMGGCRMTR